MVTPGNPGKHFTSTTPDGNLLVYDVTGQHLYAVAAAVVPEASTFAPALPAVCCLATARLGMIGAIVIKRRKSA